MLPRAGLALCWLVASVSSQALMLLTSTLLLVEVRSLFFPNRTAKRKLRTSGTGL